MIAKALVIAALAAPVVALSSAAMASHQLSGVAGKPGAAPVVKASPAPQNPVREAPYGYQYTRWPGR